MNWSHPMILIKIFVIYCNYAININFYPELVSGSHAKLLMFKIRDAETSSA